MTSCASTGCPPRGAADFAGGSGNDNSALLDSSRLHAAAKDECWRSLADKWSLPARFWRDFCRWCADFLSIWRLDGDCF